jgi:acetolactate synthase-1/2/3 large subunit
MLNIPELVQAFQSAKQPLLLVGNGVRLAHAHEELISLITKLHIPVQTTCAGLDLVDNSHPLFIGRPGWIAPRYANFAIQSCDVLLTIGTRLDLATVGFKYDKFATKAKKFIVDIDTAELAKFDFGTEATLIQSDAKQFIRLLLNHDIKINCQEWIVKCQEWKRKYPLLLQEHQRYGPVSVYNFTDKLCHSLNHDDIIVSSGAGISGEIFFLTYRTKLGQRAFHNRGLGAMGYGLPASIGACIAGNRRTVLIDGDGSIMLNIHELEVIKRLNLPIKIFVLNNDGYESIRTSQSRYFNNLIGADSKSGLTLPNIVDVASAFKLDTCILDENTNITPTILNVLQNDGPILCEVKAIKNEIRQPCLQTRQENNKLVTNTLEDLWPWLSKKELQKELS